MKIFDKAGEWSTKVNFVDENNVLVGYDMSQCCCEHAFWFISDSVLKECPEEIEKGEDLGEYSFDPDFFEEYNELKGYDGDYDMLDQGGVAVFKLTNGTQDKYLHLVNCHNGYYGHGFTMEIGDEVKREGCL
jgi:hypothetical protein